MICITCMQLQAQHILGYDIYFKQFVNNSNFTIQQTNIFNGIYFGSIFLILSDLWNLLLWNKSILHSWITISTNYTRQYMKVILTTEFVIEQIFPSLTIYDFFLRACTSKITYFGISWYTFTVYSELVHFAEFNKTQILLLDSLL